jgi:hypothetical protein
MLVEALGRAWRWQRMLDTGIYATVSDLAPIVAPAATACALAD